MSLNQTVLPALILRVESYRNQPPVAPLHARFSAEGGMVGRAVGNQLVLDDPGKYISRSHASVTQRGGQYYLTDAGSNPSIVNDRPLGAGAEIALGDGDRIVIGDYVLLAMLEAPQAEASADATMLVPAPVVAAPPPLPLFEPPPVQAPTPLPVFEPLLAPPEPLPFFDLPHTPVAAPRGAGPLDALAGARILDSAGAPGGDVADDPLGLSLFGSMTGPAPAARRAAEHDHVSPELQAFAPPPAFNAIPADYDPLADLRTPRSPVAATSPAAGPTASPVAEPAASPVAAPTATLAAAPVASPAAAPTPPLAAAPVASPAAAPTPPFAAAPVASPAVMPTAPLAGTPATSAPVVPSASFAAAPAALPVAAPVASPLAAPASPPLVMPAMPPLAAPAVPTVPPLAAPADSAILQALLDGLGLPQLRPDHPPEQLARKVGEMLRAATAGTMDVLMARALTKRESHIDMTMIAPRANNPLKFFPDADSALTQMLSTQIPGYLAPLPAIEGAFDDLKAHELAVIAGMRAALAAVVQRFDPARIEQRLAEPGRLDKLLPASRKARMWDRLVELYGELARDADEDLQRLFGEKFSGAYEQQVERLRSERPSTNT